MNPTLAYTLIAAQTLYWLYYLWQRRPRTASDDSALLLLYASQGGQAETLANHLADGLNTRASSLDAWHARHPVKALAGKTLILIASTTGDGDPPDNAIRFSRSLKKTAAALIDTRYHLLALGDKRYPHYCAYGYHLDSELQRLGAVRESPVTTVDNLDPQTITYWQQQLAAAHGLTITAPVQAPAYHATLGARTLLNPDSAQPIYHLRLDCPAIPADTALIEITIPQGNGQDIRRQYSVAAIAPDGSRGLDLIVRLQTHRDGTPGPGSAYLTQTLAIGDTLHIRPLIHHPADLPAAPRPLILIASGSGLAGILGILARMEARYPARAHGLQHWLIYGERDPDHDRIYPACLEKYQEDGILTWLDRPYSRGATREYAQHRLAAQRERLHAQLDAGAVIYICGSADKIGAGAMTTLHQLLGEKTCDRLIKEGRLHLDTF